MSPFWSSFCHQFRQCGRSGTWFIATILALVGLPALAAFLDAQGASQFIGPLFAGLTLIFGFWLFGLIRRAWKRRKDFWERRPLSSDEIRVARSKLKSAYPPRTIIKPMPDTDLKY